MTEAEEKKKSLAGSRALREASGDDLRVLFVIREDPSLSLAALADAAFCSQKRAEASLAYWQENGFLTGNTAEKKPPRPKDSTPERTGKELSDIMERESLRPLIDECQVLLSHTMSRTEINIVLGLIEDYCVDDGYILALLSYCKEMGKGSVRYMEKTAISLIDSGIDSLPLLDAYIQKKRDSLPTLQAVQRIFGLSARPLSKKEKATVEKWSLYGYGEDILGLAYDITVDATSRASIPYADRILSHWHARGLRSLKECEAFLAEERAARAKRFTAPDKKNVKPRENKSFQTDDFFQKALERSYQEKTGHEEDQK